MGNIYYKYKSSKISYIKFTISHRSFIKKILIVSFIRAEDVIIKLGAHDLENPDEFQIEVTSSNFTIHEDYDSDTRLNDIAIVHLPENVILSSKFIFQYCGS